LIRSSSRLRASSRCWRDPLVYALIGVYRVRDVVRLEMVPAKLAYDASPFRNAEISEALEF
jgi:hypothetical protein